MDKKSRTLLIFLGIISLSAVGLAAWIYLSAQAEIIEYAKKQKELTKQTEQLKEEISSAQKEARQWQEKSTSVSQAVDKLGKEYTLILDKYNSLLREKEALSIKNQDLSAELEKLNQLYAQAQEGAKQAESDSLLASLLKEKANLEVEIKELKDELNTQQPQLNKDRLAQLEKDKEELEKRLADTQKVSDLLSNDLLQERKRRMALEAELNKSAAQFNREGLSQLEPPSIKLSPIVVKPKGASTPPILDKTKPAQEETAQAAGRIIEINDKYRFVVIDIGEDSGVENGMRFNVYRQDKKVGRIEVIETRKNIAACDIKEMDKSLKVNDTIRK